MDSIWSSLVTLVVGPVVLAVTGAITVLWRQVQTMQTKHEAEMKDIQEKHYASVELHHQCEKRTSALEMQLIMLQADLERKEKETDAIIIADSRGMIKEWSPGATVLFHYPQREALGKQITIIFPQKIREAFQKTWDETAKSGRTPKRGPHNMSGLTKDNEEIPVTVWLSAWENDAGEIMYGATVRFRPTSGSDDESTNS